MIMLELAAEETFDFAPLTAEELEIQRNQLEMQIIKED